MTDQATTPATTDEPGGRMLRLTAALLAEPGSDARAGLGQLVQEIEATRPGFLARLNAANDLQRLGLSIDVATTH